MQIELLLFGIVKDVIGKSSMQLQTLENTTIVNFRAFLLEEYPKLAAYKSFSIAVNEAYVDDNHQLKENDVVALIPPVSGG
ncbi:MoaD/ThiS family protein [Aureibaculum conchae]|uniref:MoaD/ThiS family protein n=1 Tax=Aureibaculum sp. 2308TA14-22 TaxID=3108392 RepID=UPI003395170E